MVAGRQGARHGDLRHPRHAERATGDAPRRCRPRLLQPQSRHLRILLRRDHHHAHLSGPARDLGPCARRGHQRLLRRHRRHGRIAPRPRGHDRDAREPAEPIPESVPINMLVQVEGTPLNGTDTLWILSNSCARWRWRASPCRAPWSVFRPGASRCRTRCRRWLSSLAPTRCSSGPSCSPRPIPSASATAQLFARLGIAPMPA